MVLEHHGTDPVHGGDLVPQGPPRGIDEVMGLDRDPMDQKEL
jgi:hypothetical protein